MKKKPSIAVLTSAIVLAVVAIGVIALGAGDATFWHNPQETPETSGLEEPFWIYAIEFDQLPENATRSTVDPLPEPVVSAMENANEPGDRGRNFSYVAVSRSEFRSALRPFYGRPLPEMTPEDNVYYVERNGTIYRIHFEIVTE